MVEKKSERRRLVRVSEEHRANGLLRLGLDVSRIARGALGPAEYGVVVLKTAWDEVAGPGLGSLTAPDRISGKTLYVRAASGAATVELSARSAEILPRIALLLGEGVVEKIRPA